MKQEIAHVALVVRDYDEAIAFYTQRLGFELLEDTSLESGKRWVLIAPPNTIGTSILLARAANDEQLSRVGNQNPRPRMRSCSVDACEHSSEGEMDPKRAVVRHFLAALAYRTQKAMR